MIRRCLLVVLASVFALALPSHAAGNLDKAARAGRTDDAKALLADGADVNARYDIGQTALMIAAARGRQGTTGALIDAGADLNLKDNNNHTALMLAAEYGHLHVVRLLVDRGANPDLTTAGGMTALDLAQRAYAREREPTIKKVVDYLSRPDIATRAGAAARETRTAASTNAPGAASVPVPGGGGRVMPIQIDVAAYQMTPERFDRAAARAMIKRGWNIDVREANHLSGSLEKKGVLYKVAMRLEPPFVTIYFLPGYAPDRPNWLRNLEQNFMIDVQADYSPLAR